MEEPVEHQKEHGDGCDTDYDLELFAVLGEPREDGAGQDVGDDAGKNGQQTADHHRAPLGAGSAAEARHDGREDEHRLESLAEDDYGGVCDHCCAAGALAERAGAVLEGLVQREPSLVEVAARLAVGDCGGQALLAFGAEPHEAFDARGHVRGDRAQAELWAELEESVCLEAGLLGLRIFAGAHGGLEAVKSDRDEVEVRLVLVERPLLRDQILQGLGGPRVCPLDLFL